jgi:hypothetical protein
MAIDDSVLETMKPEPLSEIAGRVRDGDILLCSAIDPFSRLIAWSTKSPWTHVALAYRWRSVDRIMAFEAVQQIGVHAVTLDRFITQTSTGQTPYPGKIILARHEDYAEKGGAAGGAAMTRLADFAVDRFGDRFDGFEIMRIAARIIFGRTGGKTPEFLGPNDAFICSEYAAKCFEAVGIKIAWDGRGFIAPADFASDPGVKAIAQFKVR